MIIDEQNTSIMKKYFLFILLLILPFYSLLSQIEMGKWRTHLAYNEVSKVTQSENKVYALSSGSLFSVDKSYGEIELYSKVSGLNGNVISQMKYDEQRKQLLILYEDGNIDIMTSGGIVNIPDYFNKQQTASKLINDIFFYGDYAYLSTNFGVLVVNMSRKEITDVYYIGANSSEVVVLQTTIIDGKIYALSESEIYQAQLSSNLVNYENWSLTSSLPGSGKFQSIVTFNNELYLLRGGSLYRKNSGGSWLASPITSGKTKMRLSGGNLYAYSTTQVYQLNANMEGGAILSGVTSSIQDIEYDSTNNTYWLAGNDNGVVSYNGEEVTTYKPLGPAVNTHWNMTFAGQKLFAVPGGGGSRDSNPESRLGAVMIFEDNIWRNILQKDIPIGAEYNRKDFMDVIVDPKDAKHFFTTSIGSGLYEFKEDVFHSFYNYRNSTIENISGYDPIKYTWIETGTFDDEGNLWLINRGSKAVKIMLTTGEWKELSYPDINDRRNYKRFLIPKTKQRQRWITANWTPRGLFIFDDAGTIAESDDDTYRWFSSFPYGNDGEVLTPGELYSLVEDKNGVVWLGTDKGPLLFHNISDVFNSNYTCSRIIIPRNDGTGNGDYLLDNERIKTIAIDGANRKWLGTGSSGVYLMSDNGQETIHHFTTQNSPLLSNDIFSIAINPVSGEVFFATANGLVSYQGDAADANDVFENVYAYPNPVRESYNGIITITGLVENTQVKITDLHGNLICETISNGAIATWDGKDVRGRKVSTGIYLAICANEDGSQSAITKIMVIN